MTTSAFPPDGPTSLTLEEVPGGPSDPPGQSRGQKTLGKVPDSLQGRETEGHHQPRAREGDREIDREALSPSRRKER